jgi:hypothetical protein
VAPKATFALYGFFASFLVCGGAAAQKGRAPTAGFVNYSRTRIRTGIRLLGRSSNICGRPWCSGDGIPGEGRTPIPTPLHRFLAGIKEWAANGAACPAEPSAGEGQEIK